MGDLGPEREEKPACCCGRRRGKSTGRKVFEALVIVTLVVFAIFALLMTVGAALIPRLRG